MNQACRPRLGLIVLLLSLAGCSGEPQPPAASRGTAASAPSAAAHAGDGIAWYQGSVEDAFATAREQNKPVFMYWGAVWCPPCNQVKSTVFTRPDFIEITRRFVPVYVDGDSPGAQKLGERFGAMGYPTLIVFRPDGTELTRISSGMELSRYPEALALALRQNRPVTELLAEVLADPEAADVDSLKLLAFHSWDAETGQPFGEQSPAEVFARLAEAAGDDEPLLRNRFALLALLDRIEHPAAKPALATPANRALLREILSDPEQLRANLTELQYSGADLIASVTAADSESRDQLANGFVHAMDDVFDDETLPVKQRLLTTRALIDLHRRLNPGTKVPDELVALVERRAAWASAAARTPYERQSLIYNAASYLHEVGRSEAAKALYLSELERSVAPYYYMSYLSDIEAELGNPAAALDWARKAWDAAEGPATRAQWGIAYAHRLIELAPEDARTIEAVVGRVVDELIAAPEAFYQRTRVRMQRLDAALRAWSAAHGGGETLERLHARLAPMCGSLPEGSPSREVCAGFARAD